MLRAQALLASLKRRWREEQRADAAAALAEHPELSQYRSLALELAHCEYRLRQEAGEALDTAEFCKRFPDLGTSLYLLIKVASLLDQDPDLRVLQGVVLWPEPGQAFLGYDLLAELGRGTFGRVFLAKDSKLGGRSVALKVALRAEEEANLLGKLEHPNIVPVHSVQWDSATGLAAICMPYLGRATLMEVLAAEVWKDGPPMQGQAVLRAIQRANDSDPSLGRQPSDKVLRGGTYVDGVVWLGTQLAAALAHSHERGIFHRDLKPSNVLLSPSGIPLLLDFNLSVEGLAACGVGGTLPYMPPEVLAAISQPDTREGMPSYDARSDIFALGVILFQLLTGQLPFGEVVGHRSLQETAAALRARQATGPASLRPKNDAVDPSLAALILRCLALDPRHRPQTAADLARALRREIGPLRRAARWSRRRRRWIAAAGGLVLALLAVGAIHLATRPSYPVREFHAGVRCYEAQQYAQAVQHFGEVLREEPENAEALVARARAYLGSEDYYPAFKDFRAAYHLAPMPQSAALSGYCLARMDLYDLATTCYREALRDGMRSVEVLNGLGLSCRRLGRLDEAERYLNEAVAMDGQALPPRLNLLVVYVNRARRGDAMTAAELDSARTTMEAALPSRDLLCQTAALFAIESKRHPELATEALEYLGKAVLHGLNPASVNGDPAFDAIRGKPEFRELIQRCPGTAPSATLEFLSEPF
jgi:serine/threonine protein kinase/Tfp pilus assembly protein PilF